MEAGKSFFFFMSHDSAAENEMVAKIRERNRMCRKTRFRVVFFTGDRCMDAMHF